MRYSGANREMSGWRQSATEREVAKKICSDAERDILRTWMKRRAGRILDVRRKDDSNAYIILQRICDWGR